MARRAVEDDDVGLLDRHILGSRDVGIGHFEIVGLRIAEDADNFSVAWDEASRGFARNREVLSSVARRSRIPGSEFSVADLPPRIPPIEDTYFPLSALRAIVREEDSMALEIVYPDEMSSEQSSGHRSS